MRSGCLALRARKKTHRELARPRWVLSSTDLVVVGIRPCGRTRRDLQAAGTDRLTILGIADPTQFTLRQITLGR